MLRNADGGGGVRFSGGKRYEYEGVRLNVISVTRGWVGGPISRKKHYVTLEWPHSLDDKSTICQVLFRFDAHSGYFRR